MGKMCKGSRFGIEGIRSLVKSFDRPLLCGAIKPMGLDAPTLAKMAYEFTIGGIDMIKDDHGLSDQPFCRFKDRIRFVCDAVNEANAKSGSKTLYAPSISGPADEVFERAYYAKKCGAGALLVAPAVIGFDTVKSIAENDEIALPVIAHPAFMGSFVVNPESGISHYALFGTIMRMIGADGSVYPNFGGRFSFSKAECADIQKGCTDIFGDLKTIFPMPGGGMSVERVPELKKMYGNDVMFLIGGGLFRRSSNLAENVKYFKELSL
jgi:ribulose-bisphosphate carboxylase large chain